MLDLERILQIVNSSSEENVIDRIKSELQQNNSDMFNEWKESEFDIDHMFTESNLNLLMMAADDDYEKVSEALLNAGAQVDLQDTYGRTPLFYAARNGDKQVAKVLLNAGAQVDLKNTYGRIPLFYAVLEGHVEIVRLFLQNGANPLNIIASKVFSNLEGPINEFLIKYMLKQDPNLNISNIIDIAASISGTRKIYHVYKTELNKMKNQNVHSDCTVSFYDILIAKGNKLAAYMRNENITEALQTGDYESEFPLYADEIESQYQKGMKRRNLLDLFNTCIIKERDLFDLLDKYRIRAERNPDSVKLPIELQKKIATYLSSAGGAGITKLPQNTQMGIATYLSNLDIQNLSIAIKRTS